MEAAALVSCVTLLTRVGFVVGTRGDLEAAALVSCVTLLTRVGFVVGTRGDLPVDLAVDAIRLCVCPCFAKKGRAGLGPLGCQH